MEVSRHESRSEKRPVPVYIAQQPETDESISLLVLWQIFARHKGIVLASLMLGLSLGVAYLFLVAPVYRATAHLLPPQQQNVQPLNVQSGITEAGDAESLEASTYTSDEVYKSFLYNLKSLGLRREFFDSNNLLKHYLDGENEKDVNVDRVFAESFNEYLRIQVDRTDPSFVTVSLTDSDPEFAALWLNKYIDYANRRTVDQLYTDVESVIQAQITRVNQQMLSKVKLAEQRRLDNIVSLKEALSIAKSLGIKDTSTFPKVTDRGQPGLAVNTAQVPMYMRGMDALETEIKVLEARKSDEPFIGGFRDLQERLAFLKAISIDRGGLSAVTIDAAARVPYHAESPNPLRVLLLAAMVGLIAGFAAAFAVDAYR